MNKIKEFLQKSGWTNRRLGKKLELTERHIARLKTDKDWGCDVSPRVLKQLEALEEKYGSTLLPSGQIRFYSIVDDGKLKRTEMEIIENYQE